MPRSAVLLTPAPVDGDAIAAAAAAVAADDGFVLELRVLDAGAALQVTVDGAPVLTVLRPRPVPSSAEAARLVPGLEIPADAGWWTEAYTPWRSESVIGVAVLAQIAARATGAVHLGPV